MDMGKKLFGLVIVSLVLVTGLSGCVQQTGPGSTTIIIPSIQGLPSDNPKYMIAASYSSEAIIIDAQAPQYTLPLDLASVVNFNQLDEEFTLTSQQKKLMEKNGFIVRDFGTVSSIIEPYTYLKEHNVSIFVTSDTLLHMYHILFDQTLKTIEEREFFDDILNLTIALFDESMQEYEMFTDPIMKEAARRNVGFFGVALSLLQTPTEEYNATEIMRTVSFSIPNYVQNDVTTELSFISAHEGFHRSALFRYEEDYSQFQPRGHYTQTEILRRYFKAMMWYGRIAFLLRGSDIISDEDATIATIQACLISTSLPSVMVGNESSLDLWERVYAVTAFFVGTADDLIPFEYLTSITTVFGTQFNATAFMNETKMIELLGIFAQLRSPQIYGGTGNVGILPPFSKEQLAEILEKTKGMRLMGQRFIPDSYMFQHLVFPTTGRYTGNGVPFSYGLGQRIMPRGLDVMTLLGSTRALEILESDGDTDYEFYDQQRENLSVEFSSLNVTEWNRNLYWSWLYTLKPLLASFDSQYPSFMQTDTWEDKELQTVLSSWTELRHDTILYAKQSYTPRVTAFPPQENTVIGYVEPVPEFYTRLLSLTMMTRTGLTNLQVVNDTEINRLVSLESILKRLLNISKAELEGTDLTESDYEFIRNFGDELDRIVTAVNTQGKETTIVADVHTDTNAEIVLEEGIGYVDLIIVAYKYGDGKIITGAGPVFSYYEFKQPMSDRLTDEQWKQILQNEQQPERPAWTTSFIAK